MAIGDFDAGLPEEEEEGECKLKATRKSEEKGYGERRRFRELHC